MIPKSLPVVDPLPCTTSSVQIEQCPPNAYKSTEHNYRILQWFTSNRGGCSEQTGTHLIFQSVFLEVQSQSYGLDSTSLF